MLEDTFLDVNVGNFAGICALQIAIMNSHEKVVQLLLNDSRVDVNRRNKQGKTSLYVAVRYDKFYCTKMILERPDVDVNAADREGFSPLMGGIDNMVLTDVIKLLLTDKRIDVNATNVRKESALWRAASYVRLDYIRVLLNHPKIDATKQ